MHIEGRLWIDLYPVAGQVGRVNIQSSRPLQAAQIFEGKTAQEVLMQLPLLFSVCGIAQGTAAVRAFQQALAQVASIPVDAARALLVQMETAREHLWRILIDWPQFLEEPAEERHAAPLHSMLRTLRKALFMDGDGFSLQTELQVGQGALTDLIDTLDEMLTSLVFGCAPAQWLQIANPDGLNDWARREKTIAARLLQWVSRQGWQGLGAAESRLLPDLPEAELDRQLDAPGAGRFIAEPVWNDSTCETTPLARQSEYALIKLLSHSYGNGLLTRLVARLVELARIPATMRKLLEQPDTVCATHVRGALPEGTGVGQVEAARGRLVHRVVLEEGHVSRYQILAPTEWNFHPSGVVARGLGSLPYTDEVTLRRQAALLINAVDPCVGYELRIH